jgi:hypothetical protein
VLSRGWVQLSCDAFRAQAVFAATNNRMELMAVIDKRGRQSLQDDLKAFLVGVTDGKPFGQNKWYGAIDPSGTWTPSEHGKAIKDDLTRILA